MELLKFYPLHKPTLWGAETWLVSAVADNESVVSNGAYKGASLAQLAEHHGAELLGKCNHEHFGHNFPLLIKMIDARQDLSIQVHPGDELAARRHGKMGKNEMWYIVDADHGSQLTAGFARALAPALYPAHVHDGSIEGYLRRVDVAPGDCLYIPAGRVHSIGAGMTIAEIQQTSDVTYRIYDFMRRDAQGHTRELHTELALDAIDFGDIIDNPKTTYTDIRQQVVPLVESPYFHTRKLSLDEPLRRIYAEDSFHAYVCVAGQCCIADDQGHSVHLATGQAAVVPASTCQVTIHPDGLARLLETCVCC